MSTVDRQPTEPGQPRRRRRRRRPRGPRPPVPRPEGAVADAPGPTDRAAASEATASEAAGGEAAVDLTAWPEEPEVVNERRFEADGETWIARPVVESAIGHGAGARAYIVAVRFFRARDDTPVSEVLIPRGRFEMLYDEELVELLHRATPLKDAPEPRGRGRRSPRDEPDDELPLEG